MSSTDPQMSLEEATKAVLDGTLSHTLDPAISHKVLQSILPDASLLNEEVIETIAKYVRASEIDLTGITMLETHMRVINSQNLTSLALGSFEDATKKGIGRDLDALLKDLLNQNSRQQLACLDLSMGESLDGFADGWAKALGQLLPSLSHLSLRSRPLTELPSLCPNLQLLDISNTRISTFTGISNLKSLHTLRIGCLRIVEESVESSELFELRELRNLSFECKTERCDQCREETSSLNWYMKRKKNLPSLEFVDFSCSGVVDAQLQQFSTAHTSLKTISVGDTELQNFNYPNVTVLHTNSIKAAVESLNFYTAHKDVWMVKCVLAKLDVQFEYSDNNTSQEDIQKCWTTVCSVLETFGTVEHVRRIAVRCFEQVFEFACLDDISSEDRLRAIQIFSEIIAQSLPTLRNNLLEVFQPWNILESRELILETPHVDYDRLALLAMLFLEKSDQGDEETRPHVMILDMILDRVDPESTGFEMCDVVEVLTNLQTISKGKELDSEIKEAAKNAMNFVLNNFPVFE